MNLKEMFIQDAKNVFLNLDEFAETHIIEGFSVPCIFQGEISTAGKLFGNYSNMLIINAEDFPGRKRVPGDTLIIDNVVYTVQHFENQTGIYFITLENPEQF